VKLVNQSNHERTTVLQREATMTTKVRANDAYTVGWVCALPKEQTAATAMLDERHPNLPKPRNDPNTYTLGSIGGHDVVIACLPKGKIGTVSATSVATHMIHAFPAIRFGLMVGIGGGVPPHVRLGDVVVSVPTDQYPGVVQWDMGKTEQCGSFRRTGALNNTSTLLLTALTRLETDHELQGTKIPQYMEELKERYPRMAADYSRSNDLEDVLFRASHDHVDQQHEDNADGGEVEEAPEEGTEHDCRNCDKAQIVKRKPRDMRVHYGLIASGNQVIKDARTRDQLSMNLGRKVLCIEMEAAGLMDGFPCLVIRGICDYADSHKNKAWQKHAAAVAAAFAKELLNYVIADEVDGEKPASAILESSK
jgi:nucleoside phosphorylase